LNIKKAEFEDLNIIIDIFRNAIKVMNDNNINQWDEVYPTIKELTLMLLKCELK
jgi:DNA polymerase sigma